jgi:O-methyltransferase involved in polyketide biosynthesis
MQPEPTSPNVARIYDYLIGGVHNFAVDRAAADRLVEMAPLAVQTARLNRLFLEYAVEDMVDAQLNAFIDLASGLPTEGALHERAPETAKILYNDHDPEVVAYARQMLGARPNIDYVESKIEDIETILATAERIFGAERRVGLCLIGVVYFIADDALRHVFQRLHEWAAPGSLLAVSSFDLHEDDANWLRTREMYRRMGVELYPRTSAQLLNLAGEWRSSVQGFPRLEDIVEAELQTTLALEADRGKLGYAGVLVRR